ncbi:MAG: response regulator transcription factor [Prolixibacteraceae bacterium]|nr:response regulator transcription factor [Prolixibacteraceae bacterium]MBN2772648.1 response regulator transcription factor [Prolixibacteraceae bacterium]
MKILLAEDDVDLGNVLAQYLNLSGFEVNLATDGNEALAKFKSNRPDICVLDVMMPGPDGFEVARQISKTGLDIPFIFLTAKNQKKDKITGLKLGADDYITKPFEVEELLLRIKNILKRTVKEKPEIVEIKGLALNVGLLKLITPVKSFQLTEKEAELLLYLMENKNEIVPRELVLTKFWGENDYFMGRSLDVFISRIRKYISDEPDVKLNTIRGVGYILEVN